MKKVLCIILAVMMLSSMALTASADGNYYTTTVTYNITDGAATLYTEGVADPNAKVTHVIHKSTSPTEQSILYIDQTKADAVTGEFAFNFSVKAGEMAGLDVATAIIGTDKSPIPFNGPEMLPSTSIDGYITVTATLGEDLWATVNGLTITGVNNTLYVAPNTPVTFVLNTAEYTYKLDGGDAVTASATATDITFTQEGSTVVFTSTDEEPPIDVEDVPAGSGGGSGSSGLTYDDVITSNPGETGSTTSTSTFTGAPQGTPSGSGDILVGVTSGTQISTTHKITTAAKVNLDEYGIILAKGHVNDLTAETDKAYILKALGHNANGDWGIRVIDESGEIDEYTIRTYIKTQSGKYSYGEIIQK